MGSVYNPTGHELKVPNVVDSNGVYVIDDTGRRYMDLEAGVWCMSVGHRNPDVNAAISRQCESIVQSGFSYSSPVVEQAAERVLRLVGFDGGACVFLCSGSEAIEVSRQIAKRLTGRRTSMTLHDSYLGAYSSVSDRTRDWFVLDWTTCAHCPTGECCRRDCEVLQSIPAGVSEFVFEPGSSSGYVRFPPKSMISNVVDIVRSNGGKIVVNEVTTGTGRTGRWFGFQHYDVDPDLVAIGKGIGNGYPVSVAAISAQTMRELPQTPFSYSQSHQNDPLGAAVVAAVIEHIETHGLVDEARRKGDCLLGRLRELVDGDVVREVRGRGLMVAVDLRDAATTNRVHDELIERGFIVGNRRSSFRIDPPLTITDAELDAFVDAFRSAVEAAVG